MDIAEFFPSLDIHGLTALTITRLITILIGTMVRQRAEETPR
jgi:arginase family enzyme